MAPDGRNFSPLYPANTDAEAVRSAGVLARDDFIVLLHLGWLEAQVKSGQAPVYRYRFDLPGPGDKFHPASAEPFTRMTSSTSSERSTPAPEPGRPIDRALSDMMQQYWTNFARTGDPNGPGLPLADLRGRRRLAGHAPRRQPEAKPDAERARFLFLDKTWGKQ